MLKNALHMKNGPLLGHRENVPRGAIAACKIPHRMLFTAVVVGLLLLMSSAVVLQELPGPWAQSTWWQRSVVEKDNACHNPLKLQENLRDKMNTANRKPAKSPDPPYDQLVDDDGCLIFKDAQGSSGFNLKTAKGQLLDCSSGMQGQAALGILAGVSAGQWAEVLPAEDATLEKLKESTELTALVKSGGCEKASIYIKDFMSLAKFVHFELSDEGEAAQRVRRARGVTSATDRYDGFCKTVQSQTAGVVGGFVTAAASAWPMVGPLAVGGGRLLLEMYCTGAGANVEAQKVKRHLVQVQKKMGELQSMVSFIMDEVLNDVKPPGAEFSLGAGHGARGAVGKLVQLVEDSGAGRAVTETSVALLGYDTMTQLPQDQILRGFQVDVYYNIELPVGDVGRLSGDRSGSQSARILYDAGVTVAGDYANGAGKAPREVLQKLWYHAKKSEPDGSMSHPTVGGVEVELPTEPPAGDGGIVHLLNAREGNAQVALQDLKHDFAVVLTRGTLEDNPCDFGDLGEARRLLCLLETRQIKTTNGADHGRPFAFVDARAHNGRAVAFFGVMAFPGDSPRETPGRTNLDRCTASPLPSEVAPQCHFPFQLGSKIYQSCIPNVDGQKFSSGPGSAVPADLATFCCTSKSCDGPTDLRQCSPRTCAPDVLMSPTMHRKAAEDTDFKRAMDKVLKSTNINAVTAARDRPGGMVLPKHHWWQPGLILERQMKEADGWTTTGAVKYKQEFIPLAWIRSATNRLPNVDELRNMDNTPAQLAAKLDEGLQRLRIAVGVSSLAYSKWGFDETNAFEEAFESTLTDGAADATQLLIFRKRLLCARLHTKELCEHQLGRPVGELELDQTGICKWDAQPDTTEDMAKFDLLSVQSCRPADIDLNPAKAYLKAHPRALGGA
jgi:hypothetical protein